MCFRLLSASKFRAVIMKLLTSILPCFETVCHARFSQFLLWKTSLDMLKQPFEVVRIGQNVHTSEGNSSVSKHAYPPFTSELLSQLIQTRK